MTTSLSSPVEACPECTVARGGWTRQAAFDAFFATGPAGVEARRGMVRSRVVRSFVAGGADPGGVNLLACGHSVMA